MCLPLHNFIKIAFSRVPDDVGYLSTLSDCSVFSLLVSKPNLSYLLSATKTMCELVLSGLSKTVGWICIFQHFL